MAPISINTLAPPSILLPPAPPNGILAAATKHSSSGLIAAGAVSALLAFSVVAAVYYCVHRRNSRARLPMQAPPALEDLSFESGSADTEVEAVTPTFDSPPMVQKKTSTSGGGLRPLLLPIANSKQLPKRLLLPEVVSRKHLLQRSRAASMPPPPSTKTSTAPRFPFRGASYRHSVAYDPSCLRKLLELEAGPLHEARRRSDSLKTVRVDTVNFSLDSGHCNSISDEHSDSLETGKVDTVHDSLELYFGTKNDSCQHVDSLETVRVDSVNKSIYEHRELADSIKTVRVATVDASLDNSFYITSEQTTDEYRLPKSATLPSLAEIIEGDLNANDAAEKHDSLTIPEQTDSESGGVKPRRPCRGPSVPDMSDFLDVFESEIKAKYWPDPSPPQGRSPAAHALQDAQESYESIYPMYECISDGDAAPDWGIFTTREELALRDDDVSFYTWIADDPNVSVTSSRSRSRSYSPVSEPEEAWSPSPVLEIPNPIDDKSISFDKLSGTKRSKKSNIRNHLISPVTYLTNSRVSRFPRGTSNMSQKATRKSPTKDRRATLHFSLGAMNTAVVVASQISEASSAANAMFSPLKASKKAIRHVGGIKRRRSVKSTSPFTFQKNKKSNATRKWRDYRKLATPTSATKVKVTKTSGTKSNRNPLGRITNTYNNLLTVATGLKTKASPPPSPTLLVNGVPLSDNDHLKRGGLTEPLMDDAAENPSMLNLAWEPKSRFHKVHITVNLKKRLHAPDAAHDEDNDPAFDPLRVQTYIENPFSDFRSAVELHFGCPVVFRGAMPLGLTKPLYVPLVNDQYFRRWLNHYYQQGYRKLRLDAWRRDIV